MPKVSVIIPIYRVEDYIEKCIVSVLEQSYENLEIIIVDDCGGDSSVAKALRLLELSFREWKLVRHEQNRGLSAARNTGVAKATGDFLFFLDSDDYLPEIAIAQLVSLQIQYMAPVILGSVVYVDTSYRELSSQYGRIKYSYLSTNPFESYLSGDFYVSAWAKLINRRWYVENNILFEEALIHEDEPWTLLIALRAPSVYLSHEIVYCYVQRQGSIMHQSVIATSTVTSHVRILKLAYNCLTQHSVQITENVSRWFLRSMYVCMRRVKLCTAYSRTEKMELYKQVLDIYLLMTPWRMTSFRFMQIAYILSAVMPRPAALYIAVSVWIYISDFKLLSAYHKIKSFWVAD